MPCLWAIHGNFDAVDDAMENDPNVETIVALKTFDPDYHTEWSDAVEQRLNGYLDKQASLLTVRGG